MDILDAAGALIRQYRKEITLIVVTGVSTFIFTKALPAMLQAVKQGFAYLLAICTGRGTEYLFVRRYLKWVVNENRYLAAIPSQVLDPERLPKMPELEDVYITLRLRGSDEVHIDVPPAELFSNGAKTVVLGDPGAGKTTLLKYFCLTHARFGLVSVIDLRKRRELRGRMGTRLRRVPVLIHLNRMYRGSAELSGSLLSLARGSLPESLRSRCPERFFEKLLENGHTLMLLDGLDEIASPELRVSAAEEIAALANACHRDNAWIVTSRIVGYKPKLQEHRFRIASVEQLTLAQSNRFILHWYTIKCESAGYVGEELDYQRQRHKERAQHLIDALTSNPGLRSLATSPMLVSLIALLHSVRLELPENRSVLYRDCVELLADRWDLYRGLRNQKESLPITTAQKVGLLASLAWTMHHEKRRETSQREVEELASQYLSKIMSGIDLRSFSEFINVLQERSALMISRGTSPTGDRILTFSHLSFQEYLVSSSLNDLSPADAKDFVLDHWSDPWWKEPILLYLAHSVSPMELISEIYQRARRDVLVDGLVFAGSCLAEVQAPKSEPVFRSVVNDLAFIVSCGRFASIVPERLKPDRWNLLLRYLLATVEELSQRRAAAIAMLFRDRLGLPVEVSVIAADVSAAPPRSPLALFEREVVRFLLARSDVSSDEGLRMVARFPDIARCAGVTLRQDHALEIASFEDWHWLEILNLPSVVHGPSPLHSVRGRRHGWKDDLVARGALELDDNRLARLPEDTPNYVEAGRNIVKALGEGDYVMAAHGIHESLIRHGKVALDVPRVKDLYFESENDVMRTLIVAAALNGYQESVEFLGVFGDFIRRTVRAGETVMRVSTSVGAVQEYVAMRCLDSIESCRLGRTEFVSLLLDCLSTRAPGFRELAARRLAEIELAADDSVQQCIRTAALDDRRRVWGAVLALGGANRFCDDNVIRQLLISLYDREYTFQGVTLRTVAAHSLLRLASPSENPGMLASN